MHTITRLTSSLVLTLLMNTLAAGHVDRSTVGAEPAGPGLDERLERLVNDLEQRRQQLHIPGLAIAVVRNDEVVLARGLGYADIDKQVATTPETLFAIGSSTKPFTSTLIGMLVDEGKMDWDAPVTDYLPFFDLQVAADGGAVATLRDLLAHRTGLARMSILFVGGEVSRQEVLRAAAAARPLIGFRQGFLYNNVMYLAAGVAAGAAAGSDWDALVAERLLEPLGMQQSGIGMTSFEGDDRLASAYDWDEARQLFTHHEPRDNQLIAPAGAIVSNVTDMAQWVRFQLGGGSLGGRRLISEEQLRETWTPQIAMGGGRAYGLGWMLGEWHGQKVVEHGGNTRGYAAQVALLPESDVGFVLLANVTATPLQQLSMPLVWEAVLGGAEASDAMDDSDTAAAAVARQVGDGEATARVPPRVKQDPDVDPSIYVGTYLPTHRRAEFTISEHEGRLALTIPPNPRPFELEPPDEEGKRRFVASRQMAVSFEHDGDGAVIVMRLHQSAQEYECVRAGVELPAEIDVGELDRYLGKYRSESSGREVTVLVQNNRLAVDAPRTAIFELHPPDEEGRRVARIDAALAVSFEVAEDGRVASLIFHQQGAADAEWVRVDDGGTLPTIDEIRRLRRVDERRGAFEALGVMRISGSVQLPHSGIAGSTSWYVATGGRLRRESDYGKFGLDRLSVDGGRAWMEAPGTVLTELHGKFLEQAQRANPAVLFVDWRQAYPAARVLRAAELDGRNVWVVELGGGEAPDATVWVDAANGDIVRLQTAVVEASSTLAIPMLTVFDDFREVQGLRIPFRVNSSTQITGEVVYAFDRVETGLEVEADFFARR